MLVPVLLSGHYRPRMLTKHCLVVVYSHHILPCVLYTSAGAAAIASRYSAFPSKMKRRCPWWGIGRSPCCAADPVGKRSLLCVQYIEHRRARSTFAFALGEVGVWPHGLFAPMPLHGIGVRRRTTLRHKAAQAQVGVSASIAPMSAGVVPRCPLRLCPSRGGNRHTI